MLGLLINNFAPIVKWISQQSSELSLGVRIPLGAQSNHGESKKFSL